MTTGVSEPYLRLRSINRQSVIPAQYSGRDTPVNTNPRPTVLIADPTGPYRDLLPAVLADHAGCAVLQVTSIPEINSLVAQGTTGDVAMVSVAFSIHTPLIISGLRKSGWPRVIRLAGATDPVAAVINAVEAGACGVIRMPEVPAEPGSLLAEGSLSQREVQVVTLLADGLTNGEIAAQLSLRAATVKNHLFRIGRKLGTGDRAHIVAKCIRGGVIPATTPGPKL